MLLHDTDHYILFHTTAWTIEQFDAKKNVRGEFKSKRDYLNKTRMAYLWEKLCKQDL
jgi:hypothetical protein